MCFTVPTNAKYIPNENIYINLINMDMKLSEIKYSESMR